MAASDSGNPAQVSYYAQVREQDSIVAPHHLFRRLGEGPGAVDEVLGVDGEWHPTDLLARLERGELPGEMRTMSGMLAGTVVDEVRADFRRLGAVLDRQAAGEIALRVAGVVEGRALEPDERADVVGFLASAPTVPHVSGVRTDGFWVWPEAVTALAERGVGPEPEFLYHMTQRRYRFPDSLSDGVLERAGRLAAIAAKGVPGPVREAAPPGGKPAPTQAERLAALADWHREWQLTHEADTPFNPERVPEGEDAGSSDYWLHHVDADASSDAEREFHRKAREIMGLDPETGAWLGE